MPQTPQLRDQQGRPLNLVWYGYNACPYCARVAMVIRELNLPIPMKDTLRDPEARREAVSIGGKTQVPLLVINGRPLYESQDIVRFLREEVVVG